MIGGAVGAAIGAFFASIIDKLLGVFGLDRASRARRAAERRGAELQRGADARAENEELKRDAEIYMEPSSPERALDELEARARRRRRRRRTRRHLGLR